MDVRGEGQKRPGDDQQLGGGLAHHRLGVVDAGDKGRTGDNASPDHQVDADAEKQQFAHRVLGAGNVPRSQQLAGENADGVAQGHHHNGEQVPHRGVDVGGGNGLQPPDGVAHVHCRRANGPQSLVEQQGGAGDGNLLDQGQGDAEVPEQPLDKGELLPVAVGAQQQVGHLHIAGDHRGQSGAGHPHSGEAEAAEDQQVVAHQVDADGNDAGHHGGEGLAHVPEGAGKALDQGEGQQPPQDDVHIVFGVTQGGGDLLRGGGLLVQVQLEQLLAKQQKDKNAQGPDHQAEQQPEPEGVAHPLIVLLAEELGAEDGGPSQAAENGQVENEYNLVDNGHPGHGGGAQAAHHHVVQQVDKLGDALLDDHGHQQGQHGGVERPAANQFFPQAFHRVRFSLFSSKKSLIPAGLPTPGPGPPPASAAGSALRSPLCTGPPGRRCPL